MVMNNKADEGGGIYIASLHFVGCEPHKVFITNNLLACNEANYNGGGFHIYGNYLDVEEFMNNTVTLNIADSSGGGIYYQPTDNTEDYIEILNTIVWKNNAINGAGHEIYVNQTSAPNDSLDIAYSDINNKNDLMYVTNVDAASWGMGVIDADPLFTEGPNSLYYLSQIAAGESADSPCVNSGSDYATTLAMDTLWTRSDEVPDAGIVDMGYHFSNYSSEWTPSFYSNTYTASESQGTDILFALNAGLDYANRQYLIFGGITGTSPGTPLPGGYVTLPINWDVFTNLIIERINLNDPHFVNFTGFLDSTGSMKEAKFILVPTPNSVGITMSFAYATANPWDFASNAVDVTVRP